MTNFTGYSYATGAVTQTKNVDCKALQSQWESLRSTLSVTQTASQYNNVVDRMNSIATAAGLKCFISFPIYPHVAPAAPTP
jgi:hypothetical protein